LIDVIRLIGGIYFSLAKLSCSILNVNNGVIGSEEVDVVEDPISLKVDNFLFLNSLKLKQIAAIGTNEYQQIILDVKEEHFL
jgi:hypothetical protein